MSDSDSPDNSDKKKLSAAEKIAMMRAQKDKKDSGESEGEEKAPMSAQDKIAAMRAQAKKKKEGGETEAADEGEAKKDTGAMSAKDKIAAMREQAKKKKEGGAGDEKPAAEMSAKDKIAAMKAKAKEKGGAKADKPAPKKAAKSNKPALAKSQASLEARPGDEILSNEELLKVGLFASLKKKVDAEKFAGSILLRRYQRGDIICRQGEQGNSAFYVLSSSELKALKEHQLSFVKEALSSDKLTPEAMKNWQNLSELFQSQLKKIGEPSEEKEHLATVFIPSGNNANSNKKKKSLTPQFIRNDGPTDLDPNSRSAPIFSGDLFGEMSCMTLAPRSATIVAEEDCYALEFLRNIFDSIQKDPGYRERADKIYRERVLDSHLSQLSFFEDLTTDQLGLLKEKAKLDIVDAGTVLCSEGEPSEDVYIIRSGMVQVIKGLHGGALAINEDNVKNWKELCKSLSEGVSAQAEEKPKPEKAAAKKSPKASKLKTSVSDVLAAARGKKKVSKPEDAVEIVKSKKAKDAKSDADSIRETVNIRATMSLQDFLDKGAQDDDKEAVEVRLNEPEDVEVVLNQPKEKKKPAAGKTSAKDILAMARKSKAKSEEGESDTLVGEYKIVWGMFDKEIQDIITKVAKSGTPSDADKIAILVALNELTKDRDLVGHKDASIKGIVADHETLKPTKLFSDKIKEWSGLEIAIGTRLVLQAMYEKDLNPPSKQINEPVRIIAYMGRGEVFGEIGVITGEPRSATCVAYDHPSDDPRRAPGRVEVVSFSKDIFKDLVDSSPKLKSHVDELVSSRKQKTDDILKDPLWASGQPVLSSTEFRDQGFIQGQKLLLVDLEACTRCGDCVQACVSVHEDGRSRLFLDGPRFDRFLVPSACRNCLNPACMIGCPVGSIHRGSNSEIEIQDWCIGCGLCARQCPYDSIQMHSLAVIPEHSYGWKYAPASIGAGKEWMAKSYDDSNWGRTVAPVLWDLDLQSELNRMSSSNWPLGSGEISEPLIFRYDFPYMPGTDVKPNDLLKVSLTSELPTVAVWLNGDQIEMTQDAKMKRKGLHEASLTLNDLKTGENTIAILVSPDEESDTATTPNYQANLLTVSLAVAPAAESIGNFDTMIQVEPITEQAVVCDLCSSTPSQDPACVVHCPHDAAMRVDARFEFPAL